MAASLQTVLDSLGIDAARGPTPPQWRAFLGSAERAFASEELQARHVQKLDAVGRISSAVAHEVNGPLQFVDNNLRYLQTAMEALARCLDHASGLARDAARAGKVPDEAALAVLEQNSAEAADLASDAPLALAQALQGVSRVASIVHALRSFAPPGERAWRKADLNSALSCALALARAELRHSAEVIVDLGELPSVTCDPADLHEVFLCLLLNAARATAEARHRRGETAPGTVRIRTFRDGGDAVVTIGDSGSGIPAELHESLFDPLATLGSRRGAGEGLALAHALVVGKHEGSLSFETEAGRGTTFTIRLPIGDQASASMHS